MPLYTDHISCQNQGSRNQRLLKNIARSLLLLLFIFTATNSYAQKPADYAVHANIIYHFTKYINWPAHRKSGDFIIGVVGESSVYYALENSLSNKKVGDQKIVIKQFASASFVTDCHILFLGDDESYAMNRILEKTVSNNTLVVSESPGAARKGSCINFVVIADRLKLEINKQNIEKRKLNIASELLQLGKVVD
jgi:hypothetical protein